MSGVRGGRRGGRTGGRDAGGGRGCINLTQEDLNNLIQVAIQTGQNVHGGKLNFSTLPHY